MNEIEQAREKREASSLAILAGRLATWFKESGLVQPLVVDPDYYDDIDIDDPANDKGEFVRSLWISDTDNPKQISRYQVVQSGREVFLTRNGRAIALPARANRMQIEGDIPPATAEDFHALFRSLPKLVEVAKYPAERARQLTLRKIGRAFRPDKSEIAAQVPKIHQTIDAAVKDKLDFEMSPAQQFQRDFVFEDFNTHHKLAVIDATIRGTLSLDDLESDLRTAQADHKAQAEFLDRAPDFNTIVPQGPMPLPALSLVPSSPSF